MYWLCQGIGFEQGAVTPYLDAEKLENLIKERAEESKVTGEFKRAYEYDQKDNADQVQLLMDQIVCNETYQLAGLLASENEESVFIGVTDGDGQILPIVPAPVSLGKHRRILVTGGFGRVHHRFRVAILQGRCFPAGYYRHHRRRHLRSWLRLTPTKYEQ